MFPTPRKSICFPRQGLGWEVLGDQWSGMAPHKSHKRYAVRERLPSVTQLTVFGEGVNLKTGYLNNQQRPRVAQASSFSQGNFDDS